MKSYVLFFFPDVPEDNLTSFAVSSLHKWLHEQEEAHPRIQIPTRENPEGGVFFNSNPIFEEFEGRFVKYQLTGKVPSYKNFSKSRFGYVKFLVPRDYIVLGRHEEDAFVSHIVSDMFEEYLRKENISYRRDNVR